MKPSNDEAGAPEKCADDSAFWDAAEGLTWVSYGIFRHTKDHTQPEEPELLDWWNHILATQVAMGALVTECESILRDGLPERAGLRLSLALSRLETGFSAAPGCQVR